MLAISQIANPRLQRRRVEFLHRLAICEHAGLATDGRPFASTIDEGDVDVRIIVELIRLAGFGIGVEDEVDSVVLAYIYQSNFSDQR